MCLRPMSISISFDIPQVALPSHVDPPVVIIDIGIGIEIAIDIGATDKRPDTDFDFDFDPDLDREEPRQCCAATKLDLSASIWRPQPG